MFQSLVITAALAALVAVVCRFGRLGPVARHALWVLVLVKFVMPPLVVWPWSAPDPFGLAAVEHFHGDRFDGGRAFAPGISSSAGVVDVAVEPAVTAASGLKTRPAAERAAAGVSSQSSMQSVSPWTVFALVWMAGSLCLVALEVVRQVRLARRVRNAGPADPAIARRVVELAAELGVTPVPVVSMPGATSPAVWCLGRPRLLWPASLHSGSQACIDGVIVHELAHLKRRDHIVGWVELVAGLLWWWNPLFWSVRRALREQAELACDAWVISALPDGRRAYAESLLDLSSPVAPAQPPAAVVLSVRASSRRVLERRLVMIMNGRATLRLPWAGLLTLALLAAATLPAWATGTIDDAQPPAQAAKPAQDPKPKVVEEKVKVEPHVKHVTVVPHDVKVPTQRHTVTIKPTPLLHRQVTVAPKVTPRYTFVSKPPALTDEGKKLVSDFSTDVEAIYKEIEGKIEARRQEAIRALETLQDQYTRAGRLDEAVAIRDYLKAGGPGSGHISFLRFKGGK